MIHKYELKMHVHLEHEMVLNLAFDQDTNFAI